MGAVIAELGERLGDGSGRWRGFDRFTKLWKEIFERTPNPVRRIVLHPVRHCRSGGWVRRRGGTQSVSNR